MTSKRLKKVKRNRKSAKKSRRSKVRKSKIVRRNRKTSKFGMTDEELLKKEIEKEEEKLSYNYAMIEQLFLNRIIGYDQLKVLVLNKLKEVEQFKKELEQFEEKIKDFKKELEQFKKDPNMKVPKDYIILWDKKYIAMNAFNNIYNVYNPKTRNYEINEEFERLQRLKKENITIRENIKKHRIELDTKEYQINKEIIENDMYESKIYIDDKINSEKNIREKKRKQKEDREIERYERVIQREIINQEICKELEREVEDIVQEFQNKLNELKVKYDKHHFDPNYDIQLHYNIKNYQRQYYVDL
jgi:hypothetical protein